MTSRIDPFHGDPADPSTDLDETDERASSR